MKNFIQTCSLFLVALLCSIQGQAQHSCNYEHCGVNHELTKQLEKLSFSDSEPSTATKSAMACKRVKVYYIKPSDYPFDEDRMKYCDMAIRETQQQWASQGKTAYFEKMEYVSTNYTIADIEGDYFVFCIENILKPQFGASNGNYKVMFWVDGVFSPCCAAGGGDYAGAPGWGVQGNYNHYGLKNPNDAGMPGLIGHELGHAFGIFHEDGHPDNGSTPCEEQCIPKGIMCNGASYSPCGEFKGYPQVTITDYHNKYFNVYPDYFNELGGSCDAPRFIWDTDYPNLQFGVEYVIRNQGSNKVLSIGAGNSLVQQDYTGSANQRWTVTPEQYGLNTPNYIRYSQLINVGTGQAADNYAFNTDSGGDIVAYASNGKTNQQWRLVNRNGVYAIQNMASGRVMDVQGGSTAENANVQQWQWNETNAQLWNFEFIDPCANLGGDTDGDGICNNQDACPDLDDSLIGTACNDNNPGTANDVWQTDCSCSGILVCTPGSLCSTAYGPGTGTYDANCNCVVQPCSDANLYAGNCDLDGDGLLNGDDMDDDNDGIIDTDECPVTNIITNSSFNGPVGIELVPNGWTSYETTYIPSTNNASNGNWGGSFPTNVAPSNSSDGGTWLGLSSLGNTSMGAQQQVTLQAGKTYQITFEQANFGGDFSAIGANSNGAPGQIEIVLNAGTGKPNSVIGTASYMQIGTPWNEATMTYTAVSSGVHTIGIVAKQPGTIVEAYNNLGVDDFRMTKAVSTGDCDVDNDGIANQLDLDSDGDGCYDALEGGATIALTSLNANGGLSGNVNASTGVPFSAGAGQSLGTSQNATAQDNDCACPDSDGDGVCDAIDQCPGFDDNLIGTACNDGDPCTTGTTYGADCSCGGGTLVDSDGDGVCDSYDQCPNFNDNLIGQPCNDGSPATINDTWQPNCTCAGTLVDPCANQGGDSDGDGVCDAVDQCPGFNDNLIGTACNDGNPSTINDVWQSDCSCSGTLDPNLCTVSLTNSGCESVELYYHLSPSQSAQYRGLLGEGQSLSFNDAASGSFWTVVRNGAVYAHWNTDCASPNFIY